jgi:hypothetical protein
MEIHAYTHSGSITNLGKLRTLWEFFHRYGPIARLLLDRFAPAVNAGPEELGKSFRDNEVVLESKLVNFFRLSTGIF